MCMYLFSMCTRGSSFTFPPSFLVVCVQETICEVLKVSKEGLVFLKKIVFFIWYG